MIKKYNIFFLMFLVVPIHLRAKDLILIDKIEAVVYGPQETTIVTKSEIERPGLDGQRKDRDQIILEQLVFQDGKKYNIVDEKLVDNYIAAIQRQNNITLDDIKNMFTDAGYTYEEGREQLAIANTVNSMLDYKVRSKLIIPERDAREYYDAHPVHLEEEYKLQRLFVPIGTEGVKKSKQNIVKQLKLGQDVVGAERGDEFWIKISELAEDKNFIQKMNVGELSSPQKVGDGFEMFKLLDKKEHRLVPFEERYNEIANTLRKPLFEKLFEDYKKELFDNCVIINY